MAEFKDFKSNILSSGVARTNRFDVQIELPSNVASSITSGKDTRSNVQELISSIRQLSGRRAGYDRGLNVMCESANLPDLGFITTEQSQNSQIRKMPYGVSHDDLTMTFIVSEDLYEKKILDLWQNLIYNNMSHSFGYYDEYVSTIVIDKKNGEDEVAYSVKYLECYPMNVQAVELSNASVDEYAKITVTFAYHKWVTDDIEEINLSFFDKINALIKNPLLAVDILDESSAFGKIAKDVADFANIYAGDALIVYNNIKDLTIKYTGADPAEIVDAVRNIRKSVDGAKNMTGSEKISLENWIKGIETKLLG